MRISRYKKRDSHFKKTRDSRYKNARLAIQKRDTRLFKSFRNIWNPERPNALMIHEPCVVSLAFYNEILAFLQHNIRMFPTRDSRLCNARAFMQRETHVFLGREAWGDMSSRCFHAIALLMGPQFDYKYQVMGTN